MKFVGFLKLARDGEYFELGLMDWLAFDERDEACDAIMRI